MVQDLGLTLSYKSYVYY